MDTWVHVPGYMWDNVYSSVDHDSKKMGTDQIPGTVE